MIELRKELLEDAKRGMQTPEGAESLTDGEIEQIAGFISASIVGGAWAAMDEFGTGSLMDTSNPALSAYKNTTAWNPVRQDNKIRSRPNRPGQVDIFGNPVNGRGIGGFDLEGAGKVSPTPPSKAIQTAARWMQNGRMQRKIKETLRAFPFGRFIITDRK